MERSVYNLTLDVQSSHARWELPVKQGDTHRRLRLRLVSGGAPYPITEDCYGVFTAQKPDGTVLYNNCSREGEVFVYDLTPQTTAAVGVLHCQLRLYGAEDALLTSAAFTITVEPGVYREGEEAITSTGEASALTQMITRAGDTIARMEAVLENEPGHAVIDDLVVGQDAWSSKEIADRLCPAFTKRASAVQCEPLAGYPLEVVSSVEQGGVINLRHSGKNLLPKRDPQVNTVKGTTFRLDEAGTIQISGTPTANTSWDVWSHFPAEHLAGKQVSISNTVGENIYTYVHLHLTDGTDTWSWLVGNQANKLTAVVPENVKEMTVGVVALTDFDGTPCTLYPQLELGSAATAFASPVESDRLTADLSGAATEGTYDWVTGVLTDGEGNLWQHDPAQNTVTKVGLAGDLESGAYTPPILRRFSAFPGENVLISSGTVTVTGREDPVAILQKLSDAVLALGGKL